MIVVGVICKRQKARKKKRNPSKLTQILIKMRKSFPNEIKFSLWLKKE